MPDPEQNWENRVVLREKNIATSNYDLEQGRRGGRMTDIVLWGLPPAEGAVIRALALAATTQIFKQDCGDAFAGTKLGPAGGHMSGGQPEGQRHPGQQAQKKTNQRRTPPPGRPAKPVPVPIAPTHAARPLWFRPVFPSFPRREPACGIWLRPNEDPTHLIALSGYFIHIACAVCPAFRLGQIIVVEENAVSCPIEIIKLPALECPEEAREADQP